MKESSAYGLYMQFWMLLFFEEGLPFQWQLELVDRPKN